MSEQKMIDRDELEKQVAAYEKARHFYVEYKDLLDKVLEAAVKRICRAASIESRAKEVPSFAKKFIRRWPAIEKPLEEFTDLAGARIIVQLLSEVEQAERWVREHFTIDEKNSQNTLDRLEPEQFGYRSVHLIVSVNPDKLPKEMARHLTSDKIKRLRGLKAEIQIRTIAQHAWSEVGHDRIYKGVVQIPFDHRRQNAKIAAMIEEVDHAFVGLVHGIEVLETNVGAYKTLDETKVEIDRLSTILLYEPNDSQIMADVVRRQISIGQYDKAIAAVRADSKWKSIPELQICLGQALTLKNQARPHSGDYLEGQSILAYVAGLGQQQIGLPAYLEANTFLAESFVPQNKQTAALEKFAAAFEADPHDPRALAGYLRHRLAVDQNEHEATLLRSNIQTAAERCRAQIAARVNLPYALYHLAEFEMLLQPPSEKDLPHAYAGMYALCRAIALTKHNRALLQMVLGRFELLCEIVKQMPWLRWARRTLMLAMSVPPDKSLGIHLHSGLKPTPGAKPIQGRVLIIAGGCDREATARLGRYEELLHATLADFHGTVICGGTKEGISGLVGKLCTRKTPHIRAVGYLPKSMPGDGTATRNPKQYELRNTTGRDQFTAIEPIQNWVDLLSDGIYPGDVKLIGINGGDIAGFEYHLAAALGADVAVIRESGRQADKLMLAETEPGNEAIHFLPDDVECLRALITYPPTSEFKREQLVDLSAGIQRAYNEQATRNDVETWRAWLAKHPGTAKDFERSNRMQAEHIPEKLRRIGKKAVEIKNRKPVVVKFTEDQVKVLAPVEHGRWVVERTWAGWKLGPRDDERKIRTQLVAWDQLPKDENEKDLNAVRAIPKLLADIGYEIQDE